VTLLPYIFFHEGTTLNLDEFDDGERVQNLRGRYDLLHFQPNGVITEVDKENQRLARRYVALMVLEEPQKINAKGTVLKPAVSSIGA
jgi:hypothetical protein